MPAGSDFWQDYIPGIELGFRRSACGRDTADVSCAVAGSVYWSLSHADHREFVLPARTRQLWGIRLQPTWGFGRESIAYLAPEFRFEYFPGEAHTLDGSLIPNHNWVMGLTSGFYFPMEDKERPKADDHLFVQLHGVRVWNRRSHGYTALFGFGPEIKP